MGTGHRSNVQLQLIAGSGKGQPRHRGRRVWRLDARTREIGREGVAQAREILSRVNPPEPPGHRYAS